MNRSHLSLLILGLFALISLNAMEIEKPWSEAESEEEIIEPQPKSPYPSISLGTITNNTAGTVKIGERGGPLTDILQGQSEKVPINIEIYMRNSLASDVYIGSIIEILNEQDILIGFILIRAKKNNKTYLMQITGEISDGANTKSFEFEDQFAEDEAEKLNKMHYLIDFILMPVLTNSIVKIYYKAPLS